MKCNPDNIADIIGIGFGPSNLSLAIAAEELAPDLRMLFLERRSAFEWHPNLILPNATMQISFLKDLANFRNPRSAFTFVNYLKCHNRLQHFANLRTFNPTRHEFADYLRWCESHFTHLVSYNSNVISVELDRSEPTQATYRIHASTDGVDKQLRARSIVYAGGIEPVFPEGVRGGRRIFHAHNLLRSLAEITPCTSAKFIVVGSGQSGAEVVEYLLDAYPNSEVIAISSKFGYTPADESAFVNQIFDAENVDLFFNGSEEGRQKLLGLHANTNYSVADLDVINRIYEKWYHGQALGRQRLSLRRMSRVDGASVENESVSVQCINQLTGSRDTISADYLICATGFRVRNPVDILSRDLADRVQLGPCGLPKANRFYRLCFEDEAIPPLYSVATTEPTHGLTATLLSNMAVRSGEIVADVSSRLATNPSFAAADKTQPA